MRESLHSYSIWIVAALIGIVGCGGNVEISGTVHAPNPRGKFMPAANVEILLVKGDILSEMTKLAKEDDAIIQRDAVQLGLAALKEESAEKSAELTNVLTNLRNLSAVTVPDGVEVDGRNCLAYTQSQAENAEQLYNALFASARASLAALGVIADTPQQALDALESKRAERLAQRAVDFHKEYMATRVTEKSSVILNAGNRPDELCWTVTNNGPIGLVRVDLHVVYNGKHLPESLARKFWELPAELKNYPLVTRNEFGEEVRGISNAATVRTCFNATQRRTFTREEQALVTKLGLSGATPRVGRWEVRFDNPQPGAAPPVSIKDQQGKVLRWEFPERPLAEVYSNELRPYSDSLPESALIAKLSTSETASRHYLLNRALTLCKKAATLHQEVSDAEPLIEALEKGKSKDKEVQEYLRNFVSRRKHAPDRRRKLVGKAEQMIEQGIVLVRKSGLDGTYSMEAPKGSYTMIASAKGAHPVTWIFPVEISGEMTKDFTEKEAIKGSLLDVLELKMLGPRPTNEQTAPAGAAHP